MRKMPRVVAVLPVFHDRDLMRARLIDDADLIELRVGYAGNPLDLNYRWLIPVRDRVIVSLKRLGNEGEPLSSQKIIERLLYTLRKHDLMIDIEVDTLENISTNATSLLDTSVILSLYFKNDKPSLKSLRSVAEKYLDYIAVLKLGLNANYKLFPAYASYAISSFEKIAIDLAEAELWDIALLAVLGSRMVYGHAGYKMEYKVSYKLIKSLISKLEQLMGELSRDKA